MMNGVRKTTFGIAALVAHHAHKYKSFCGMELKQIIKKRRKKLTKRT
jgi:hypothetical protein